MTRPRVLFVAPVEPWCRENGSSLIIADLLEALAARNQVELLAVFVRRPPPEHARRDPEGVTGVLLDIPGLPRWASVAGAFLRGSTPLRLRFNNGRVARRLLAALRARDFRPDLVHVEHLPLVDIGATVARACGTPLVYRAHNVESQLWARRLGLPRVLKDRVIRHMERAEADASRVAQLTLCISPGDLAWLRAAAPGVRAELFPCSLRLDRYDRVTPHGGGGDAQLCFVGGLDWAPNEAGLQWFVHQVLPRITAAVPRATLAVLARGAATRPWLRDHPAVRVLPPESDAATLFASSRVSLAPLFQAGGVRIKIPESLALGCPVVATTIGGEGHDLPDVTTTDDPEAFAVACVRYLQAPADPGRRQTLRGAVEARYGALGLADRLVGLWSQLIGSWATPRL